MERNKIIERVYRDPFFVDYINSLTPNNREEAHSEFIVMVCEIPEKKIKQLHQFNELTYYCIRMIRNMVVNPTSNFNKMFNERLLCLDNIKPIEYTEDEIDDLDKQLQEVRDFISSRSERVEGAWADEKLFDKYIMEGRTYRQIAAETGIHYVSLFKSMKLIKGMLKMKFKCK